MMEGPRANARPQGMSLVSAVDASATVVAVIRTRDHRAARAGATGSIDAACANDGTSFGYESRDAQERRQD
jgi:hypothetical protein